MSQSPFDEALSRPWPGGDARIPGLARPMTAPRRQRQYSRNPDEEIRMKRLAILLLLAASPAFAQQQPDAQFLQRAIVALQTQRNQALDAAAGAEARAAGLADDLAKAQARIKELEQKQEAPPK
jgi:hypothetical protein